MVKHTEIVVNLIGWFFDKNHTEFFHREFDKIEKDIADLRKFIKEKFLVLENIISMNEVDEELINVRKY